MSSCVMLRRVAVRPDVSEERVGLHHQGDKEQR
jgi:hypothetical protein